MKQNSQISWDSSISRAHLRSVDECKYR